MSLFYDVNACYIMVLYCNLSKFDRQRAPSYDYDTIVLGDKIGLCRPIYKLQSVTNSLLLYH